MQINVQRLYNTMTRGNFPVNIRVSTKTVGEMSGWLSLIANQLATQQEIIYSEKCG